MSKTAYWKRREESLNDFNAIVVNYVSKGTIYGELDMLKPSSSFYPNRHIDTSKYVFITTSIVDIVTGDTLEINDKKYKVNHVDNPLFMNSHLEIELEVI